MFEIKLLQATIYRISGAQYRILLNLLNLQMCSIKCIIAINYFVQLVIALFSKRTKQNL